MKKIYTKKQLKEAIVYWSKILESMTSGRKVMNENQKFDPTRATTVKELVDGLLNDPMITRNNSMTWSLIAVCEDRSMGGGRMFQIARIVPFKLDKECDFLLKCIDGQRQRSNTTTVMELKNKIIDEGVKNDYAVVFKEIGTGYQSTSLQKICVWFDTQEICLVFGNAVRR